ncbi:OmpA family protein [Vibrio sp. 10N.222.52.C3]|uniref:OmpA family protein n=1 Tax=Vibrio sp. 10N.222.52.C3 TaxID=3229631 RepID=UPI00354B5A4E
MNPVESCSVIPLHANYYLFGTYFPASRVEGEKQKDKVTYPTWHKETSLVGNQEITNVRPLAKVPMLNLTNSDNPALWATNQEFKLCSLGNGKPDKNGVFEVLSPECPIHSLGKDLPKGGEQTFNFRFPSLPLIASLAELSPKELAVEIAKLSGQLDNSEVQLTLTEISTDQLADPYQEDTNGQLSEENAAYNKWYEEVRALKQPLKGFVLPVVSSCAIVFSDEGYLNASVSLYKFKVGNGKGTDEGKYEKVGDTVQAVLPKKTENIDQNQYPCALFYIDSAAFDEGLYSIRVEFIPSQMDKPIPDFVKNANIEQYDDGLDTAYTYELREHISFSSSTPLGKFAIVSGDMISLEESLIYQYPQYFSNMKHYLHGNAQGAAANTPASRSLTLLKNIRDVSAQLGAGLMSGSLQETLDSDGRQAVFNNVSKLYWDTVKTDMPPAMKAAGELYYGIYSTKAALDTLRELHSPQTVSVGWKPWLHAKVLNTPELRANTFSTAMEAAMGNRKVVAGRVAEAWLTGGTSIGVNAFGTVTSGIDLVNKAKAVLKQGKKVETADKATGEVADDYLKHIPVWKTRNTAQEDKIDQALEKAREKSKEQITAYMVNDSRGAGIGIKFEFNSKENELKENEAVFMELGSALAEVLEAESNLRVEVEGHACQVDTAEKNMQVAADRAENAKALLLKVSSVFKDRISIEAFGESRPIYLPVEGEKIDRNNPNLKQNRRVVIRIYMQSFDVYFHPSRYGSQAMERSRLALEIAMSTEDKLEAELRMAVFDSLVDVASYVPVVAPVARGVIVAKEGTKAAISAVKMIDHALLDSLLNELNEKHNVKRELERLSNIHIELLKELRKSNIALERKEINSYKELVAHFESEESRKELLKRYQLRALAINGLVLLLADLGVKAHADSLVSFESLVKRYKVKDYIERYILGDDWSVHTIKGNTMAANWKNQCENQFYDALAEKMTAASQYWPAPISENSRMNAYSWYQVGDNNKASGAFNRVFPVQTMLFEHPEESMFENFTQAFNPQDSELKKEAIGFCRILIKSARFQESDKPDWLPYDSWIKQSDNGHIGPYDKVKVQIVLTKAHKYAQEVTVGYNRVDGLENINGPAFRDWMLPKKVADFETDPNGEIAKFYKQQGVNEESTLIAIDHCPSYRFGSVMIDGMKPMTSKSKLLFADAIFSLAASGSAKAGNPSDYFSETDSFKRYVKGGGFQNMRYSLSIRKKKGDVNFYLPADYIQGKDFDDLPDELKVGVLSTETKLVLLDTYLGEKALLLREKDLMVESFTLMNAKSKKNSIPVIKGIKQQVVAIETQSSGLNFFQSKEWINSAHNIRRDGFSWGNKGQEDPASMYVLLLGDTHNKDAYESTRMDWGSVNMSIQLGLEGNKGKLVKGPRYFSDMHHVGEFSCDNGSWELTKSSSEKNRSEINAMKIFIDQAVASLEKENDLQKGTSYTVYCMKFDLGYVAPTGAQLKGLRPFGGVIGGKANLELSVTHLNQVDVDGTHDYDKGRDVVVSLPSLSSDKALAGNFFSDMPWLIFKEPTKNGVDKSASETWKQYEDSERKKWLKHWIEKQPAVTQAPKPLEKSLDNPI